MTIKELIYLLKKLPQDKIVSISTIDSALGVRFFENLGFIEGNEDEVVLMPLDEITDL